MGFGDVASILIPAVKIVHQQYDQPGNPAVVDVLTFGAGVELMSLVPEVNTVLAVEAVQWVADPSTDTLLAVANDGGLLGFAEVGLRSYAEGCETSPLGYLEGWYVDPRARRRGVGRALMRAAEDWARSKGCTEMASDTEFHNEISQEAHERLGYERVETIVVYRRSL